MSMKIVDNSDNADNNLSNLGSEGITTLMNKIWDAIGKAFPDLEPVDIEITIKPRKE